MGRFIRRSRGALGIALTWSVAWAAAGAAIALILGLLRPSEIDAGEGAGMVAVILGLAGFLSGLGFAGLLSIAERARTLADLSSGRAALWGFLGGAAIPALMGADIGEGWITGTLGGALAAGTVAIARRAHSRRQCELPGTALPPSTAVDSSTDREPAAET